MNYDEVLTYLGKFGSYQKRTYFLVCLPTILCAFHKLVGVFLLATPDHRCLLNNETANSNFQLENDFYNISYPIDESNNEFSKCTYYKYDDNSTQRVIENCIDYIWDTSKYESSAVKSFNLVCDNSFWRASADSFLMAGVFFGSLIAGHFSDMYGRKPVFIVSLLLQLIFGILTSISPGFITYTICRMIVGATTTGVFLVAYCLSLEMVSVQNRIYAGVVFMMFFSFGYMLISVIVFFVDNDWRMLQVVLTIPGSIFLVYWWFIPESNRWLLNSSNRKHEAITNILKIAESNKVIVPKYILDNFIESEKQDVLVKIEQKKSILDLFKHRNLRTKALLIFLNWFVISGTYYGLSWNTNNISKGKDISIDIFGVLIPNKLVDFFISGAVEIPAYVFLLLTLNRWGRKKILTGSMTLSGIALLISVFLPKDMNRLMKYMVQIGKMGITASYGTIYVFSAEQFPTVIRNVALGAASMSARVGGILAPLLIHSRLTEKFNFLPPLVFGIAVLIGGILSTLLPETNNMPLLDTIEDGERFGGKKTDQVTLQVLNESATTIK
ncbi:unnamed protein product [Diamesa serratosioi]